MKRLYTHKQIITLLFLTIVFSFCISFSFAQPDLPQQTLSIIPTQAIRFGTICVKGSGGTVVVGWDGSRTSTGEVVLLSRSPSAQAAVFEIKLFKGRNVIISFDATTILTGSNGGELILDIGPTEKGMNGASFSTQGDGNFITQLRVGGTLHIPGIAPRGSYTGSFGITFNQQ